MPIPALAITDEARGRPRQPVPLRYACLVTGLSCANFRYLLTSIQEWGEAYLTAYEHGRGEEHRAVRPDFYRTLLHEVSNDPPSSDFLATLPADHLVWSDELPALFHPSSTTALVASRPPARAWASNGIPRCWAWMP